MLREQHLIGPLPSAKDRALSLASRLFANVRPDPEEIGVHRRFDPSGADGINPDAFSAVIHCQGARQLSDPAFRRTVGRDSTFGYLETTWRF